MADNLVIVESPAKAKTIKKYLGKDFEVIASYGHVRDLLPKTGSVEPDNDFAMHYELIEKNIKHVQEITKAAKNAKTIYLAPDPDREGEAICWHIQQILQAKKLLKNKTVHRIAFHEITKKAVQEAIKHPRDIDMNLVNSQQARRALDYLVGFTLSPLLWKKVQRGLSAGRVQSPALRLIVEREAEIKAFKSQEYWTILAACDFKQQAFDAKLIELNKEKVEQFTIVNEEQANAAKQQLTVAANGKLIVSKVDKKQRKRNPAAPFTTSTLQQEASRKLGFSAKRTMQIAQQLYEGMDVGDGATGLITYMRTDSVNLSVDAVTEIRQFIVDTYGKNSLPETPQLYKTKAKNAQEAHEAIRPTSVLRVPQAVEKFLTAEQAKLYNLIWQRSVACQMIHATLNVVAIDLDCGKDHTFRANGSTIAFPGFMSVYQESTDGGLDKDNEEKILPELQEGDVVKLQDVLTEQHFTEPPPRYTEASLVKALEEYGIGRPSTYATIISTLINRKYVTLDKKRFYPTDVGEVVNNFLVEYFTRYVDYDFTAKLEDDLDNVANGDKEWIPLMEEFWRPFKALVGEINTTVQRKDVTQEITDEVCPKCGKKLLIRLGRNGKFIGCSGYPDCDYTRNLNETAAEKKEEPQIVEGRVCEKCGSPLVIKTGRFGKFIACSGYPKCKYIESLDNKPEDTKIVCPECGKGTLLKRRSRRYGKDFYSCSEYPKCKYAVWNSPVAEECPKCHWKILTIKTTKRHGTQKVCPQKDCGYVEQL